jgi:hypothetical protein
MQKWKRNLRVKRAGDRKEEGRKMEGKKRNEAMRASGEFGEDRGG